MARRRIGVFAFVVVLAAGAAFSDIEFQVPNDAFSSAPAAVFLAGSFNDWKTTATPMTREGAYWTARLALPDGRHFYKFVWQDARDNIHWINDPTNPFIADNGERGANNFVDVQAGRRAPILNGLEAFQWPPSRQTSIWVVDGPRRWRQPFDGPPPRIPSGTENPRWVSVAGDFNDWRMSQFPLVRCPDGLWRAYIPIQRPFSYKLIVGGRWLVDPSNEVAAEIEITPGRETKGLQRKGRYRVPDGFGQHNSFREQAIVSSPSLVTIDRTIQPGNLAGLDVITSHARAADYGRAVALARKVREVNIRATGADAPIVLKTLALEAKIHKRWAQLDEAAECWKALVATDRNTTDTRRSAHELVAYYLFVKRDQARARAVGEWLLRQSPTGPGAVQIMAAYAASSIQEHRYDEGLATVEQSLARFAPPDGKDDNYAYAITELWLIKGICHFHRKEWDKAKEAFNRVIEIHPFADAHNVLKARKWLGFVERRQIDPYDPF